jgi:long-subunit fatty acid transport protein
MKLSFFLLILNCGFYTYSQNEDDALRYSQTFLGGTARNLSMGGAMTAIGGDFTAGSQNPASMAQFNKNNFSFTPSVEMVSNQADFYGTTTSSTHTALKIGNLSYLKSYNLNQLPNPKGWATMQLGFGINRLNSFANYQQYKGVVDGSIINNFIQEAEGVPVSDIFYAYPFSAGLAYDTYLIDPDSTGQSYTTSYTGGDVMHDRIINSDGGIMEYSLIGAANYKNTFYLGGSFNINRINYSSNFKHFEEILNPSDWINTLTYTGFLNTTGTGVNFKLGSVFLPSDRIKLGLAFHSPTFYKMKDEWGNDMKATTDDPLFPNKFVKEEFKPTGDNTYRLVTPLKINISGGFLVHKQAIIGVEFEYIDYSTAKLKYSKANKSYAFTTENQQIKNIYKPSINFKIGGEYKIFPALAVRLGYAVFSKPYTQQSGVKVSQQQYITGGFGLNFGKIYLDFATVYGIKSFDFFAYNPAIRGSQSSFQQNNINLSLSVGIRFN